MSQLAPTPVTALLIIDVQHVLSDGHYAVFESKQVIERINSVSHAAREHGALVVVIQHESTGGALDHGSVGWQLAANLEVASSDQRVRKTAADSFHRTPLQEVLVKNSVERLVICGFQSEFCVDTTTRRALALGYEVVLVSDGHSTLDNAVLSAAQIAAHHNETLCNIRSFGVRVRAESALQACVNFAKT